MEYIIITSVIFVTYKLYNAYVYPNDQTLYLEEMHDLEERCLSAGIMLPY